LLLHHLVLPFSNTLPTGELLDSGHVDAVHACAIVGEKSSQWTTHDFASVDNAHRPSEQPIAVRENRVVDVQIFEDFDHGERRAR